MVRQQNEPILVKMCNILTVMDSSKFGNIYWLVICNIQLYKHVNI